MDKVMFGDKELKYMAEMDILLSEEEEEVMYAGYYSICYVYESIEDCLKSCMGYDTPAPIGWHKVVSEDDIKRYEWDQSILDGFYEVGGQLVPI